jgi:hypothetical protein
MKRVFLLLASLAILGTCPSCDRETARLREEVKMLKEEANFLRAENVGLKKEIETLYKRLEFKEEPAEVKRRPEETKQAAKPGEGREETHRVKEAPKQKLQ